ncbi:MAG: hypothetical protein K1X28_03265 [Parachlamydiales bacterium]|nr:hypothetical protein [Parachlamydiales bacterium]
MGLFINPNSPNRVPATGSSVKSNQSSAAKETASKVDQVMKTPELQGSPQTALLADVRELARRIQKQWNELTPGELAEQIVDLEGRVALLEGNSPQVESIRRLAEHLHFQFVFPIVLELARAPLPGMPYSFARTINEIAKQVLSAQSLEPIKQLNPVQIDEIMRFAAKVGA